MENKGLFTLLLPAFAQCKDKPEKQDILSGMGSTNATALISWRGYGWYAHIGQAPGSQEVSPARSASHEFP